MNYTNEAGTIVLPYIKYSKYALDVYRDLNPEKFTNPLVILPLFNSCLRVIENKHNQNVAHVFLNDLGKEYIEPNKKVLLAFSGGLDSAYQALWLREQGYDVTLFHVKNMNYYTNGKEYQVVQDFATHFDFKVVYAEFKQNTKDGPYKKFWRENSFKNTLLYCMMYDYCIENNISNISSGDDLRLDIKDTVVGTNVADAWQVTTEFFKWLNIKYIGINGNTTHGDSTIHKGIRLKLMKEKDAYDYFYSCVNPGRFNQSNHKRIENKFGVKLEKWNCGVCRKCAYHSLLRHYFLDEQFPQEFVDFCWEKICNGADYEFFKPELPLEKRIQNLYDY